MDPSDVSPKLIPDKKIIKKIPGQIPAPFAKEKDGYVDLKKMSVSALKELLQRQIGILSNRLILSKLADKGLRISMLKKQIEDELRDRDEVSKTTSLLSQISLQQLSELEWTSNVNPGHTSKKTTTSEEAEVEHDPLHIIATHSGVYNNKRLTIKHSADTLVTPADVVGYTTNEPLKAMLTSAAERSVSPAPSTSSSVTSDLELYSARICEKYDRTTGKDRFRPNRVPKSKCDNLKNKEIINKEKKKSGLWEDSSAAPPPPVHGDTKLLSLQESLALQQEQTERLKYIQTKHAAERLMSLQALKSDIHVPTSVASSMAFREKNHDSDESDDEDHDSAHEDQEVYDDEPADGPTVVCTVLS